MNAVLKPKEESDIERAYEICYGAECYGGYDRHGKVATAWQETVEGRPVWHRDPFCIDIKDLPRHKLHSKCDNYITNNEIYFQWVVDEKGERRIDEVDILRNIVIDIDCHHKTSSTIPIECVSQRIVTEFSNKGVTPNVINYTGRGLHIWFAFQGNSRNLKAIWLKLINAMLDYTYQILSGATDYVIDRGASVRLNSFFRAFGSNHRLGYRTGLEIISSKVHSFKAVCDIFGITARVFGNGKEQTKALPSTNITVTSASPKVKQHAQYMLRFIETAAPIYGVDGYRHNYMFLYYNYAKTIYPDDIAQKKAVEIGTMCKEPLVDILSSQKYVHNTSVTMQRQYDKRGKDSSINAYGYYSYGLKTVCKLLNVTCQERLEICPKKNEKELINRINKLQKEIRVIECIRSNSALSIRDIGIRINVSPSTVQAIKKRYTEAYYKQCIDELTELTSVYDGLCTESNNVADKRNTDGSMVATEPIIKNCNPSEEESITMTINTHNKLNDKPKVPKRSCVKNTTKECYPKWDPHAPIPQMPPLKIPRILDAEYFLQKFQ